MAFVATLLCLLATVASLLFYFVKRRFSYWKRLGIPHDKPDIPYGNIKGFMKTRHGRDIVHDYYKKFKGVGPFVGMYFMFNPAVLVLDLDLVRDVLIKDFNNFTDRGMYFNEEDDPLSGHLFALDGEKWRTMRNKISPTFTSGKMKFMFPIVSKVGHELVDVISNMIHEDPEIELKDVLARFTTDVIGTCAFGIECNSLKDPNVEFRVMGAKAFRKTRHSSLVEALIFGFPKWAKMLRMRIVHEEIHQFFLRVVRETVEYREKHSIRRNDFMDLMIDLKNSDYGLTVEQVAAQAFLFFIAGFEISASALSFALYELALNQNIQDELRTEIDSCFEKHNGEFLYEDMNNMPYMEKVIKETLRKYSITLFLMRQCRNAYQTSKPNFIIPKGVMILIQIHAFQNDPDIFPDPDKFDPERFSPEETQKRHPMAWLPFGDGPRNCVGLRFARMQIYIGLTLLLRNYKFLCCKKTPIPMEFDLKSPVLTSKEGIYLRVEKIR